MHYNGICSLALAFYSSTDKHKISVPFGLDKMFTILSKSLTFNLYLAIDWKWIEWSLFSAELNATYIPSPVWLHTPDYQEHGVLKPRHSYIRYVEIGFFLPFLLNINIVFSFYQ